MTNCQLPLPNETKRENYSLYLQQSQRGACRTRTFSQQNRLFKAAGCTTLRKATFVDFFADWCV